MFVFETSSRVQNTKEGIRFYEQDALCSVYAFSGDQKIDFEANYLVPGLGIIMVEENGSDISKAFNAYLFKIGTNDFRCFARRFDEQEEFHTESCFIEPSIENSHVRLLFTLKKNHITMSQVITDPNQKKRSVQLGEADLPRIFTSFRIGIYSSAGNILRSMKIVGNVPPHWRTSIVNTEGGRIAFFRDEFHFENCEHRAEIVQDSIPLKKGKYWLKYDTEAVNGEIDIHPFVLSPMNETYILGKRKYDRNLEDHYKDILQTDGSFELEKDGLVWLKFQGKNGIVRKICIVDNPRSSYVESWDKQVSQDGSRIRIPLNGLEKIEWFAVVYDVPDWTDLTKPCPYGIIDIYQKRYTTTNLGIIPGKEYKYSYSVKNSKLEIEDTETKTIVHSSVLVLDTMDNNKLSIMYNVTMTLYSLVLIDENGNSVDVISRKTYKKFIPGQITSPIIVTDGDIGEPLDLSSSYREIVTEGRTISLFGKNQPIRLNEDIPINSHTVTVYGIPRGAYIHATSNSIDLFSTKYSLISEDDYRYSSNSIEIDQSIRNFYEYIAVEYQSLKDFVYEFTNYEREIFDGGVSVLNLEHPMLKDNGEIIVYGILKDVTIHENYIYRIPDKGMISSIDYYADDYDVIPAAVLSIDYEHQEIRLREEISRLYQKIIVDYLKADSYSINYRSEHGQYEVDISTNLPHPVIHADMHEDGMVYDYIDTTIVPDKEKYVVIGRKG